jgi:hypothetical protein
MRIAIAFLTKYPGSETINFANKIGYETNFKAHIIVDSMEPVPITEHCTIVQLSDSICMSAGFKNCNIGNNVTSIKKNPTAWDKFLYFFCELNTSFDFVWVFEDDVFIPNIDVLRRLINKYTEFDLVTANNFVRRGDDMSWYWPHIIDKIPGPHFNSMVCAAGISKNLLEVINKRVKSAGELFYIESLLNTLAIQNSLSVHCPLELKSIVWMGHWGIDEFILLPNNIFHPLKDIEKYPEKRELILAKIKEGYTPKNNLPGFITELLPHE